MIVLDTNVLSEVLRSSPSQTVLRWLAAQEPMKVYLTTITQAEVLLGIAAMAAGKRRTRLQAVIEKMLSDEFEGRILPFDEEAARTFANIVSGRIALGRPISQFDAMIAAIARTRRATLATRNVQDFAHCDVRIINPWDA